MIKKKIKKKEKKPFGHSQSMLLTYLRCEQEAEHRLNGYRLPDISTAPWFGTLFAKATEDLYNAFREGKFKGVPDDAFLKKLIKREEKWLMADANEYGPKALQETEMMMGWLEALLGPYCRYWKDDFKAKTWYELESEFDVTWNGFRLIGRRDGLMRIKKELWLLETKTKGRIEEGVLMDSLGFDFQNEFYVTGSETELEGEEEIKGVIYNIVRRPGQMMSKKDKTLKDLFARIAADVEKQPEHYFKRFEIPYPKKERERFQKELLIKLGLFQDWRAGRLPTIRRECSCTMGRHCDYLGACSSNSMKGYIKLKRGERR